MLICLPAAARHQNTLAPRNHSSSGTRVPTPSPSQASINSRTSASLRRPVLESKIDSAALADAKIRNCPIAVGPPTGAIRRKQAELSRWRSMTSRPIAAFAAPQCLTAQLPHDETCDTKHPAYQDKSQWGGWSLAMASTVIGSDAFKSLVQRTLRLAQLSSSMTYVIIIANRSQPSGNKP